MAAATGLSRPVDAEPVGIFVLTMTALAGPRNSVPDGRRYAILAFARGDDEAGAAAQALRALDLLGWDEGVTLRCGEIVDAAAVPEDLREPMARARRDGCALVVYDED